MLTAVEHALGLVVDLIIKFSPIKIYRLTFCYIIPASGRSWIVMHGCSKTRKVCVSVYEAEFSLPLIVSTFKLLFCLCVYVFIYQVLDCIFQQIKWISNVMLEHFNIDWIVILLRPIFGVRYLTLLLIVLNSLLGFQKVFRYTSYTCLLSYTLFFFTSLGTLW